MDFRDELKINENNLDAELSEQASKFLHIAEKAVQAEKEYQDWKLQVETLEVNLDKQIREQFEAEGKKITEKQVEMEVKSNRVYQEARKKLIELSAKRDLLKNLRDAWYMRKDLLIQMAINKRAELTNLINGVTVEE